MDIPKRIADLQLRVAKGKSPKDTDQGDVKKKEGEPDKPKTEVKLKLKKLYKGRSTDHLVSSEVLGLKDIKGLTTIEFEGKKYQLEVTEAELEGSTLHLFFNPNTVVKR